MTVATFTQTNNTTQTGTQYLANLDGDISVHQQLAGVFAPHQAATPNMTVLIDAGSMLSAGTLTNLSQQTSAAIVAPATSYFRIDRVVLDQITGAVSVVTGSPTTGTPIAPAIPYGKFPCAQISLAGTTLAITNSIITDERCAMTLSAGLLTQAFAASTLTASSLVDISGAAAGQIKFPATQNPSADPNTLDDYEEGTWTPSIGGTATYTLQTGKYTKIGNVVTVSFSLRVNVIGTGNTVTVIGLPFADPGENISSAFWDAAATAIVELLLLTSTSALILRPVVSAVTSIPTGTVPVFANGAEVIGTVNYTTAT